MITVTDVVNGSKALDGMRDEVARVIAMSLSCISKDDWTRNGITKSNLWYESNASRWELRVWLDHAGGIIRVVSEVRYAGLNATSSGLINYLKARDGKIVELEREYIQQVHDDLQKFLDFLARLVPEFPERMAWLKKLGQSYYAIA